MSRSPFFLGSLRGGPLLVLGLLFAAGCMHNRPDAPAIPVGPDSVELDWAYSFKTWTVGQDSGPVHIAQRTVASRLTSSSGIVMDVSVPASTVGPGYSPMSYKSDTSPASSSLS